MCAFLIPALLGIGIAAGVSSGGDGGYGYDCYQGGCTNNCAPACTNYSQPAYTANYGYYEAPSTNYQYQPGYYGAQYDRNYNRRY